ncbi:hypothetical protein LY76DRAFT_165887 [Colletotrichum caudatum]|nr:hypothetical protein LY76DRAFT_165887 [Colletotrichum caudatum]
MLSFLPCNLFVLFGFFIFIFILFCFAATHLLPSAVSPPLVMRHLSPHNAFFSFTTCEKHHTYLGPPAQVRFAIDQRRILGCYPLPTPRDLTLSVPPSHPDLDHRLRSPILSVSFPAKPVPRLFCNLHLATHLSSFTWRLPNKDLGCLLCDSLMP